MEDIDSIEYSGERNRKKTYRPNSQVMFRDETRADSKPTDQFHTLFNKISPSSNFKISDISYDPEQVNYAICLHGKILDLVFKDDEMFELLLLILFCAKSVVAHSLMPGQKAQLVSLVKDHLSFKPVTLGVGNSNSDLQMLQSTDISVGITQGEQSHISITSDFSIQRFGHLRHLIFKHGRYFYFQMSKVVLLFIYKNFFMTMLFFGYMFLNDYSGAIMFDGGFTMFYNLLFTTIPLIAIGLLNQDLPIDIVTQFGSTYHQGISRQVFGWAQVYLY